MKRWAAVAVAAGLLGVDGTAVAQGGPITRAEALASVFPGADVEAEQIFPTQAQLNAAARLAGVEVESGLVARYVATRSGRVVGRAYVDTHVVRTKRESLLISLDAEGRVQRIDVTAFLEPPDYLASERWLEKYEGRALDPDVALQRAIRPIAGATLTATATNAAVRRSSPSTGSSRRAKGNRHDLVGALVVQYASPSGRRERHGLLLHLGRADARGSVAVINHPWQPAMLALHVLAAPISVAFFGMVFRSHTVKKLASTSPANRRSGWTSLVSFAAMALSGYALQVAADPRWIAALVWLHVGTSLVFLVGYGLHLVIGWRLRSPVERRIPGRDRLPGPARLQP